MNGTNDIICVTMNHKVTISCGYIMFVLYHICQLPLHINLVQMQYGLTIV